MLLFFAKEDSSVFTQGKIDPLGQSTVQQLSSL